jgi:hypothetical protein
MVLEAVILAALGGLRAAPASAVPVPRRRAQFSIRCVSGILRSRTIREIWYGRERNMRIAGIFTGIGGLELGLHEAGHEAILFAESWAPAAAALEAHFPDIPNAGDITRVRSLPTVDLLTAGFPCQDLSQAGRTAGLTDKNSDWWMKCSD